jgi:hypothetical protein
VPAASWCFREGITSEAQLWRGFLGSSRPKTAEQTLPAHPLLKFTQAPSRTGKVLPLGLVGLSEQAHVGVQVHPLGPLGERLHCIGADPESLSYLLGASRSGPSCPCAGSRSAGRSSADAGNTSPAVRNRHPPAAPCTRADEPGSLSPEVASSHPKGTGSFFFRLILPITSS